MIDAPLQPELDRDIRDAYAQAVRREPAAVDVAVAVRSSATAEDLPDASFAGQQETFLNVTGDDDVVRKVKEVFASLYNDRAIAYRVHHGFKHEDVFLSAGVQLMVRSDVGASGVLFTLDTESGFRDVVFITAQLRPRRDRRAGRGEPGRVLRLQADAARRASRRSCAARSAPSRSAWCIPTSPASACATRKRRRTCATHSPSATTTCRNLRSRRW